jgi:hypothetical protein
MKAWRRRCSVASVDLQPGPVLAAIGGDLLESTGTYFLAGGTFLRVEVGPTADGPFAELVTDPIVADPQNTDATGHTGEFARARVEFTSPSDFSAWSNVVEVLA